ncbi:MAG: hypothetical protein OXB88_00830, partial [Bacteriovoracales bacterium]|nr:hypothetical protein [Bacteriovoracales bacterium]
NKGKVTALHPDKIGRRQRGATEACFLHVAGKRRGSRLPRLPGGEQLPKIHFRRLSDDDKDLCHSWSMSPFPVFS